MKFIEYIRTKSLEEIMHNIYIGDLTGVDTYELNNFYYFCAGFLQNHIPKDLDAEDYFIRLVVLTYYLEMGDSDDYYESGNAYAKLFNDFKTKEEIDKEYFLNKFYLLRGEND